MLPKRIQLSGGWPEIDAEERFATLKPGDRGSPDDRAGCGVIEEKKAIIAAERNHLFGARAGGSGKQAEEDE